MNTLWLVIWRFQPFHKGHLLLVETSIKETSHTTILVGSINQNNDYNPYSYALRREIILSEIPENIFIWGIPDFPDDLQWIAAIVSYIPEDIDTVILYCWDKENDSAVKSLWEQRNSLPFTLEIKEIPRSIIPISATQVREYIDQNNIPKLKEFLWENTIKKLMNS